MNLDFSASILNQSELSAKINNEASQIFSSPQARKGRTLEQIKMVVEQGQKAESFMIQVCNCVDNTELYGDVITQNGDKIECKTSKYSWTESKKLAIVDKIKTYNPSDYVFFWYCQNDTYIFQGKLKLK